MKSKWLNLFLIITSLIGYLEWPGNNHLFLFKAEMEIISKLFSEPQSVLHPFILLPLAAQMLLLITLFQKRPSKLLTFLSMVGLGILLCFMFIIGLISVNYKIVISTIPFLFVAVITMLHDRAIEN